MTAKQARDTITNLAWYLAVSAGAVTMLTPLLWIPSPPLCATTLPRIGCIFERY